MRILIAVCLGVVLVGDLPLAAAQTTNSNLAEVLSAGADSCGKYIAADSQGRELYLGWALGFITGMNYDATGNDKLIGRSWDRDAALLWLQNYCTAHPLDPFVGAVYNLREDLAKHEGIER